MRPVSMPPITMHGGPTFVLLTGNALHVRRPQPASSAAVPPYLLRFKGSGISLTVGKQRTHFFLLCHLSKLTGVQNPSTEGETF
jgi:hypothetical protein